MASERSNGDAPKRRVDYGDLSDEDSDENARSGAKNGRSYEEGQDRSWVPPERDIDVFGPPPLPPGEDRKVYDAMLLVVGEKIGAKDIIEEFLIHDIVYLQVELQRLRRTKADLAGPPRMRGVRNVLDDIDPPLSDEGWTEPWIEKESKAFAVVRMRLSETELTNQAIADEAFFSRIDDIERLDRMIAQAELRRALALREIHRHREALAQQFVASLKDFDAGTIGYNANHFGRRRRR